MVELFHLKTTLRVGLSETSLRGIPDIDFLCNKLHKNTASLGDLYKLYVFTKSLQSVENLLQEHSNQLAYDIANGSGDINANSALVLENLKDKYLNSLNNMNQKFANYQNLIEHVIDFNALPEFIVDAKHDEELLELRNNMNDIHQKMENTISQSNRTWWSSSIQNSANSSDIRIEKSPMYGYIMRTTKGKDPVAFVHVIEVMIVMGFRGR